MRLTRMRCPRQHVAKPTSACSRSDPSMTAGEISTQRRSARHASHGAAKCVASDCSQMTCLSVAPPYAAARSANFAKRFRNESLIVSVGPFRCFARMTSASPCWSVSSGL